MALPTPTPTGQVPIVNGNFESGNTGWTLSGTANIVNEPQISGNWAVKTQGAGENQDGGAQNSTFYPVVPSQPISLNASGKMTTGTPGTSASVSLYWYDANFNFISVSNGQQVSRSQVNGDLFTASVNGVAPTNASYVKPAGVMNVSRSATISTIYMDNFSWDYAFGAAVVLTAPTIKTYSAAEQIPYRVTTSVNGSVGIQSIKYYYQTKNPDTDQYENPVEVATVTEAPYAFNLAPLPVGDYAAYGIATLTNGIQVTTNIRLFDVGAVPPPDTREYKASNAYTYMVGENFESLGSSLPPTSVITGVETVVNYSLEVLVRAKNVDITDPTQATPSVAFDIVNSAVIESALLSKTGNNYTVEGTPSTANIVIDRADFTLTEQGVADGEYKWAVYTGPSSTATLGGEDSLFALDSVDAAGFIENALGIRFYPILGTKPAYASSGDAVFRIKIDSFKIRVYFDAGSVEYYFVSPDKTQVIKAELAASSINDGSLKTSDASGVMQLTSNLEIVEGTQSWIGSDWTIHSFYPPTNANKIGDVAPRTDVVETIGMKYNGLPSQDAVFYNRSRYEFIAANFYGDESLDAIYGVTGLSRAFCYNGEFFYKIQTQPELAKDMPRHVAFHHSHLALGYSEGRVDISVVGQPYNFDGALGASSWAIGDSVVGLTRLPGAMLGVFGSKSISGISGTTVDNFATQTISPNIGAIEYTVTDMGFPVYANAYGIYTLTQTSQYGDYLGNPLSQAISPWLRPRLVRKFASAREVVVAWPVRSKNQYRLAFADGYVLSMTMNYGTQATPTFSKQKYFITEPNSNPVLENYTLLDYPAIYPIAVSSELDDSGEERIHIAHYWAMS